MDNRVQSSDRQTQMDLEGLPRHIELTNAVPTYQMKASDTVLIVLGNTGEDASGIVTLPSTAEAAGKFYYVIAPTGLTDDDVSLFQKETDALIVTSPVGPFNADNDYVLLFSTGTSWLVVIDGVA